MVDAIPEALLALKARLKDPKGHTKVNIKFGWNVEKLFPVKVLHDAGKCQGVITFISVATHCHLTII